MITQKTLNRITYIIQEVLGKARRLEKVSFYWDYSCYPKIICNIIFERKSYEVHLSGATDESIKKLIEQIILDSKDKNND